MELAGVVDPFIVNSLKCFPGYFIDGFHSDLPEVQVLLCTPSRIMPDYARSIGCGINTVDCYDIHHELADSASSWMR